VLVTTPELSRRQLLLASLIGGATLLGSGGIIVGQASARIAAQLTDEERQDVQALVALLDSGELEMLRGGVVVIDGWVVSVEVQRDIRKLHASVAD
jgi:hypothetical protein